MRLTPEQIDRYRRDGFVVVEDLLPEAVRRRMKSALAELVEASRAVETHDQVYDLEPGHTPANPRVRRIKKPHLRDEVFDAFMRSPAVLDIVSALLGPSGVRLHGSKLNLKAAGYGSPVEWHQDWAFYPHTNDDVCAMGVYLDDATQDNGAMLVIPGSHDGPLHDHHHPDGYFCGAIDPERSGIDFSRAVALTAPAGACSFHHARLLHGSAQNLSDRPRNLLLYEFAAADAYPLRETPEWTAYEARLLRGESSVTPRLKACPVRLPFPPPPREGSIYESQSLAERRFFAVGAP